jgi:hypothetical protein
MLLHQTSQFKRGSQGWPSVGVGAQGVQLKPVIFREMGTVSTPTSSIHPAHTGEEDPNRAEPEPRIRTPTTHQLNQQADLGFDWPELVTDGQNLPDQNPAALSQQNSSKLGFLTNRWNRLEARADLRSSLRPNKLRGAAPAGNWDFKEAGEGERQRRTARGHSVSVASVGVVLCGWGRQRSHAVCLVGSC